MANSKSRRYLPAHADPLIDARCRRERSGGGRGRGTNRDAVVDLLQPSVSVVHGRPEPADFIDRIVDEMKIRGYAANTISNYRSNVLALLRWHGGRPHQINRNHIREFLLTIADSGLSRSKLAGALSAIRTVFDDFCCRTVTLGLVTPRCVNKLPVILSQREVQQLIDACVSQRDKMLVSLLYATGMRVSEVVKLRWQDIDFERNCINVLDGKGNVDRNVQLPDSYRPLLTAMADQLPANSYLFPGEGTRPGRYLSTRTVERVVVRATRLAAINKHVTPHSLRHAFATHLFESGTDIRLIQKLLGHANLETTCIYTRVAKQIQTSAASPLDQLPRDQNCQGDQPKLAVSDTEDSKAKRSTQRKPVGRMPNPNQTCSARFQRIEGRS